MSHRQYVVQTTDVEKLNVRLLSISFSKDEKDWRSVLHTHPFTELFFVVAGEGKFLFREKSYQIKTGDLVIIPPYMEHTEQSTRNSIMSSAWKGSPFSRNPAKAACRFSVTLTICP